MPDVPMNGQGLFFRLTRQRRGWNESHLVDPELAPSLWGIVLNDHRAGREVAELLAREPDALDLSAREFVHRLAILPRVGRGRAAQVAAVVALAAQLDVADGPDVADLDDVS